MPNPRQRKPRLDLNPSSADRWTTCTASPAFILENWDKCVWEDNQFNREGTTAHEVAAALLQDRKPDPEVCPTPIDREMHRHAWSYLEYVEGLRKPFSTLLVEQKLPLWYMPGRNAIVDVAVLNPQEVHVVDYKYGEGIVVHPENNLQAVIYARCVVTARGMILGHEFPISLHIYQPRGRNAADSPFHVWETTWGEIQKITLEIECKAEFVQHKGAKKEVFAPSEKACQWCPAKGFCGARQAELGKYLPALSEIQPPLEPFPVAKTISTRQLTAVLKHKEQIIRWLKDAEAYALQHLRNGGTLPGYKLVLSRGGNRYWSNPKAAMRLLLKDTILKREEVVEETIIGPGAVEKLLGKHGLSAELTSLINKHTGQPVIAPEDDSREAILIDAKKEFTVLEDDFFN